MQRDFLKIVITLAIILAFTVYGVVTLGLLDRHKIVITTLATTGPDYGLIAGQIKLLAQTPGKLTEVDLSGIMVADESSEGPGAYLGNNYMAYGDYFVVTVEVVGLKKSDGIYPHPLVKILQCRHVNKILFWVLVVVYLVFIIVFLEFVQTYKLTVKKAT